MWSSTRKWQIAIASLLFVLSILVMQDPTELLMDVSENPQDTQRGDYYLRDTAMVLTNTEGQPVYQLLAERMDYFPKLEHTELAAMQLNYFPSIVNGDPPKSSNKSLSASWQFNATRGFLPTDGLLVELTQGVTAQQVLPVNSQFTPLKFATQRVDIYLDDETAVAPASTIRQGKNELQTEEMRLYLAQGLTELEGQVQARYHLSFSAE